MNKQRKVLITITYNEMGVIIDTKAEELGSSAQPEIVRCKECKHYRQHDDQDDLCVYTMTSVKTDDYCSYAERREG